MNKLAVIYDGPARRLATATDRQGRVFLATVVATEAGQTLTIAPTTGDRRSTDTLTVAARGVGSVALVAAGDGRLTAIWNQQGPLGSQLHSAWRVESGRWSAPAPIPSPAGAAISPAVTVDRAGRLWCAYQSNATGVHHIYVTWLEGGEWSFGQRISDGDGHCFAPAICPFGEGARVVWDGRIDGTYGVYMREVDTDANLSQREPVAVVVESPTLVANAAIAAIDNESSLVIYEKAQKDWGRRNKVGRGSRTELSEGNYLQAHRKLHGAMIGAKGIATLRGNINRTLDAAAPSPVRTGVALGHDGHGGLWMACRQIQSLADAPRETGFVSVLSCYREGRWSKPMVLPDSGGSSDMPLSLTADPAGGLLVAYASRDEQVYRGHVVAVPAAGVAESPATKDFEAMETADFEEAKAKERTFLGDPYVSPILLWGDLHRHSNLSDCRWWVEGSPADAYRYALEAAELDFLAVTDHHWSLATPDTRAEAFDLAAAYNLPGVFTAFAACEMSLGDGDGHMVVLTDQPQPPTAKVADRAELLERLADAPVVGVPHHPGDPNYRYNWAGHDDAVAPIAEIYQPYRTSFEGPKCPTPHGTTDWLTEGNKPDPDHSLQAAWRAGLKLGVVASSDHLATGGAFAGVWADGATRRDILDALRARRCYAATDKIHLEFWADKHFMGSSYTTTKPTIKFKIRCLGSAPIKKIELLADGDVAATIRPGAKKSRTKVTGEKRLPAWPGEHYYYVRVTQADRNMAWSSPIWVAGPASE